MILYFTGTGNSRHVAEKIAEATGDAIENIAVHLKKHDVGSYTSEKPYVFVGPVYAGRFPKVMIKYIEKAQFAGSHQAYFVATCAETPWITAKYTKKLADAKGFDVLGFRSVLMPQSYTTAGMAQPDEVNRQILAKAEGQIDALAKQIAGGARLQPEPLGKSWMSTIANPLMYATMMSTKKFTVGDACIGCGTCVKNCPLGNIRLVDGKPVWGRDCTQCCACIGSCPVSAIEYGKKTIGKSKYYYGK
jgi:ferredoxin/flavodoxin